MQPWWDRGTENYGTSAFEREEISLCEVNEVLEEGSAVCIDGYCEGDVYALNDKGNLVEFSCNTISEDFVILETDIYPNIFSAAYRSRKDAIESLKEMYTSILPEDFDFTARLVCYQGVTWG